ncbi:VOC family protein [Sutcliffiella rhizosphaerae]|uniref:VOC domain-containing protein n=1 Tax=Sutcliffiella rhizosphaerae TaxID=2880967 RepID=A0ABM8YJS0_9BACI|nr:VOC family protein [Sutcliffiella rhizosphaerae]CAG9620026.1 hypothetical protein BACCIP111883_00794 [Sutcliffiella rhizosphaerae]
MDKELLYGVGIFISVRDLEISTEWYRNMLGFEVLHNDEPQANVLIMGNGVVTFCLVKSYEITQPTFPRNDYNVNHYYGFHTRNVKAVHQQLLEKDANLSDIHEFDGMQGFHLYDPDGNRHSVVQ